MYNQENRKKISVNWNVKTAGRKYLGQVLEKKMLRCIFLAEKSLEPAFNIIVKCSEN